MAFSLTSLVISLIVNIIVIVPSLWLAGRVLVGGKKARFIDSIYIVVAGTVVGHIVAYFLTGWIAALVQLVIWLGLVKHYFDASWGRALLIAIVAVVIFVVVSIILAIVLGIAIFGLLM